jgi:transposase
MSSTSSTQRKSIELTADEYEYLRQLTLNKNSDPRLARRAKFILGLAHGMNISDAARIAGFSRPAAYRWLDRAQRLGLKEGLTDKPYETHTRSADACGWIVAQASNPPAGETWTLDTLARHIRTFSHRSGYSDLNRITAGGVLRILEAAGFSATLLPPKSAGHK